MSFSAHRPGRFGSDGRIEFTTAADEPAQYLSDLRASDAAGDHHAAEDAAVPADPPAPPPTDPPAEEPVTPEAETLEPATPDTSGADKAAASARRRRAARPRTRVPMLRRLAILGGAEGSVLDDAPSETPRFVQMFFVLAGTALVSALSMVFALITGVRIAVWLAVPLALVWALIIFNLDRFLTSTMRSTRNVWRLIGLALPRVVMAALIGIVVAEPLVLQVFSNDISREVNATNVVQAQTDQDAVTDGPEKEALDEASAALAALQDQAATGIVAGTSSTSAESASAEATVDDLTAKLADQQAVIDQARALYQCELTGEGAGTVDGCTGVSGDGASAEAAEDQLAAAQAAYDDIAAQLQEAQSALTDANTAGTAATAAAAEQNKQAAQDQLPAAQEQYDAALAAYNERAASVASANAGAVGLLSQMSALERLSAANPSLAWAHWLIAALFFMIELLPVIVKVLTSYGDPSLYEKVEAMQRQVSLDRVTARTWRQRADIVTNADAAT